MTSFSSERTIEYSLIRALEKSDVFGCRNIIPFYYWKTREGTKYSKECFKDKKLKIIALFPRRPKPSNRNNSLIELKFHRTVLYEALKLEEVGISVIAGTSLTNRFEELNNHDNKIWFNITGRNYFGSSICDDYKVIFDISNESKVLSGYISTININQVITLISEAETYTWIEIIDKIEKWRSTSSLGAFYFSTRFKPVFLIGVTDD